VLGRDVGPELVNRRRLLRLAGGTGLAITAAACASSMTPSAAPSPTVTAGPAPPPATPMPTATAVSHDLLCREAWGALPPREGGTRHTINRMTLHHTGVALGDNQNAPARLRQHQRLHQDGNGWIDIAYHMSVDRNGDIYQLRDYNLVGDTATEYDPTGHFLVLCEGDFDQEEVTDEQLNGAAFTFAWAAQKFHIASDTLKGHSDFAATACPGADLYAGLSSGEIKRRVDDLLTAGPVDLKLVCGPEAATIVESIEAGQ
jgi:hypothetical protein